MPEVSVLRGQNFSCVHGENKVLQFAVTTDGEEDGPPKDLSGVGASAVWTAAAVAGDVALVTVDADIAIGGDDNEIVTVPISIAQIRLMAANETNYHQLVTTDAAGQTRVAAQGDMVVLAGTP